MKIKILPSVCTVMAGLGFLAVAGCVTPDAPAYVQTSTSAQPDTAGGAPRASGRVGLVIAGNTERSVDQLQTGIQQGKEVIIPNTRMLEDLDPVYVNARLLAALKRAYPSISIQPSAAASVRAGNTLTVTADVQHRLGKLSGQTTTVDIVLGFQDGRGKRIAKVSGRGAGTIPYPAYDYRLQQAADQALDELSTKL